MKTHAKLADRATGRAGNRMKGPVATIPTPGGGNRKGVACLVYIGFALVMCSCSKDDAKVSGNESANVENANALIVAEREMMTKIIDNEMHSFTGVTNDPDDTIAYYGLHSYRAADRYEDRAFIPWNGKDGYVVFEVSPGLGPFKYYGIAVGDDGKASAVGAVEIVKSGKPNAEGEIK